VPGIVVSVCSNGVNTEYRSEDQETFDAVNYRDPSRECNRILEYLKSTENVDELLDGVEESSLFRSENNKTEIESIVGKRYRSIAVFEIDDVLAADYTFPLFRVVTNRGVEYDNCEMGMGEFLCFYIFWFLHWVPKESILLLDEIDTYLSAYSQRKLVDFLAYQSSERSISVLLTTHSQQVIEPIGLDNTVIIAAYLGGEASLVKPKHEGNYLVAWGLSIPIRGAILVEDYFAELFLVALLRNTYPELLEEFEIIQLRCDSNIVKVAKHFEPHKPLQYELLGIFDADQSSKIGPLSKCSHLYVSALPAGAMERPEITVWSTLISNQSLVAASLGLNVDTLRNAIDYNQAVDHHDRIANVAKACALNLPAMVSQVVRIWISNNEKATNLFGFSLKNRRQSFTFDQVSLAMVDLLSSEELKGIVGKIENNTDLFRICFNGINAELVQVG
jgi:hypothetical protein